MKNIMGCAGDQSIESRRGEDSRSEPACLCVILEYHVSAAKRGREDYAAMCEDGDDTYLCRELLSLAEQHEKFADILRASIGN